MFGRGSDEDRFTRLRKKMVERQIIARGIDDQAVIRAMLEIPRHEFVPAKMRHLSYTDSPLPIGFDQTISQPYIVALMSQELQVKPGHKVLEIGTGSGYQAAVLSRLAGEVHTVEIVPELYQRSSALFRRLELHNIFPHLGDGSIGLKQHAPFDRIIVTAAPGIVPDKLIEQLADHGRLILPVGTFEQKLVTIIKHGEIIEQIDGPKVRFVPMTGIIEKIN